MRQRVEVRREFVDRNPVVPTASESPAARGAIMRRAVELGAVAGGEDRRFGRVRRLGPRNTFLNVTRAGLICSSGNATRSRKATGAVW
jgi:hypothetical protein